MGDSNDDIGMKQSKAPGVTAPGNHQVFQLQQTTGSRTSGTGPGPAPGPVTAMPSKNVVITHPVTRINSVGSNYGGRVGTYVIQNMGASAPQNGTIIRNAPSPRQQVIHIPSNIQYQQQNNAGRGHYQVSYLSNSQPVRVSHPHQHQHTQYAYNSEPQTQLVYLSQQPNLNMQDYENVAYIHAPTPYVPMKNSNDGTVMYVVNAPTPSNGDGMTRVIYQNASPQNVRPTNQYSRQIQPGQFAQYRTYSPKPSSQEPGQTPIAVMKTGGVKVQEKNSAQSPFVAPAKPTIVKKPIDEHQIIDVDANTSISELSTSLIPKHQLFTKRDNSSVSAEQSKHESDINKSNKRMKAQDEKSQDNEVKKSDEASESKVVTHVVVGHQNEKPVTTDLNLQKGNEEDMEEVQEWVCDICKLAVFPTFEEAATHEKVCEKKKFIANQSKLHNDLQVVKEWICDKCGDAVFSSYEDAIKHENLCSESGVEGGQENKINGTERKRFSPKDDSKSVTVKIDDCSKDMISDTILKDIVTVSDNNLLPTFLRLLYSQFRCFVINDEKESCKRKFGLRCYHCIEKKESYHLFPTNLDELVANHSKMFLHSLNCSELSESIKLQLIDAHTLLKEQMNDKVNFDWERGMETIWNGINLDNK